MALKVAFVGFRHPHIFAMYSLLKSRHDVDIVAACEEDAATRAGLPEAGVAVTHTSYTAMLAETDCDVVACGDYFRIRGQRTILALKKGRHVLSDKPLCTEMRELERIQSLSESGGLRVGCMLDLCDLGPFLTLHRLVRGGAIGEVHTVCFLGQHPLLYGKRPMWFFEDNKHGGSLNDIAIHGIDLIPWITGRTIVEVTASRAWNAKIARHPNFQDGAALMLQLDNRGVVIGDVSYLSSDNHGYSMDPYWRITISGTDGVIETSCNQNVVRVWRHDEQNVREELVDPPRTGGFFEDFLSELAGNPNRDGLTTPRVLESTRIALLAQHAADTNTFPTPV
jgi:predicted dehydrogenase